MQALISGEVAAFSIGIGLVRQHIASGRLHALAMTGFPSKDALPGVPPLTQFYPDAEYIPWQAAFGPKGMPREMVARLNAELVKALTAPDVRSRLAEIYLTAAGGTPEELDKTVRADMNVNRDLVKSIGLKLD